MKLFLANLYFYKQPLKSKGEYTFLLTINFQKKKTEAFSQFKCHLYGLTEYHLCLQLNTDKFTFYTQDSEKINC